MPVNQYIDNDAINIASGRAVNHRHIHKFGYNPDAGVNYEDIWAQGGQITFATAGHVATIASNLANAGSEITIQGLDIDYNEIEEVLLIDGSGNATGTKEFLRINRAFVSNDTPTEAVMRIQLNSVNTARIEVAHQQTMQNIYTVPRGHTAYLTQISIGIQSKDKDGEFRLYVREYGGSFRTRDYLTMQTNFIEKHYPIPLKFPEKTDIKLQSKLTGSDAGVSGTFDLILVKGR